METVDEKEEEEAEMAIEDSQSAMEYSKANATEDGLKG